MSSPSASPRGTETRSDDLQQDPGQAAQEDRASQFERQVSQSDGVLKPKTIFSLLKTASSEWSKDNVPRMGAALAYYTIFSLAPLLVIAIAVAGLAFGMQAAQGEVTGQIQGLIGRDGARAVQALIQSAYNPGRSAIASMIGVIALLLGATGVLSEMRDALNTIWHVNPQNGSGIWALIKSRFLSLGLVLGIGFLLLVSLLLSAALAALEKYLGGFLSIPAVLLQSIDLLFSLLFITVLFAMIFKLLPDIEIAWSDVWVGAGLTSLLFTVGKFAIGFYIGKSVPASAYGAAGSLVVVVAWIYYSALLLYFGAEFTRVYAIKVGSQRSG
ncbi:MAG TPA: YihY/virulence factor BrkB family protein [Candidatus Acidoferrum sp.]|jgi:membrane protein